MTVEIMAKTNTPVHSIISMGNLDFSEGYAMALSAQIKPMERINLADTLNFLNKLSVNAMGRK